MNWKGQNVLIVGAARQGLAMARYLSTHGARVILNDNRSAQQMQAAQDSLSGLPIEWVLGGHPLGILDGVTLVCVSGGVPLDLPMLVEAQQRGIRLTNDSQIFMELVPCKVVGITGSSGKTTTTTLVGRMAVAGWPAPARVWVGGNIGSPLIASVDEMKPEDLVIMELSSFQLEMMTRSPQVAAILNVTPNHLDRHGSMESYTATKARLLDFQNETGMDVLGREDPGAWSLASRVHGRLISFGLSRPPSNLVGTFADHHSLFLWDGSRQIQLMDRSDILLRGEHNLYNVLAACAIAYAAGLPIPAMRAGVTGFTGVQHRLQLVRTWKGVDWYNDSIATAPERAMAAIRAFEEPLVVLAGGRDKKLPWDTYAELVRRRVDHLVVFGEAAPKIIAAVGELQPGERPYTIDRCEHLHEAVLAAAKIVEPGDVVLLSPGGTSFDEFNDFEERGERFEQWVKELS